MVTLLNMLLASDYDKGVYIEAIHKLKSVDPPATDSRGCLLASYEDVRGLLTTLKKLFFWNYPRNTWQWDLLCVVILIFIFLTPKGWFTGSERLSAPEHQTVLLEAQAVDNEQDRAKIESRVKTLTGRDDVTVLAVRKILNPDGSSRGFEVDIR